MRWSALEAEAPELAALGRERVEAARLVMLGTIRSDGSPQGGQMTVRLWSPERGVTASTSSYP